MIHQLTGGNSLLARSLLRRKPPLLFKRPQPTGHNQPNTSSITTKPSTLSNTSPVPTEVRHVSPSTIPGPIWLWTQPLDSYSRMHKKRPYIVQVVSATIIYLFGDLVAQSITPTIATENQNSSSSAQPFLEAYDLARTARALAIGSFAAIPGYHWFLFLARNFNYSSKWGSIVLKVLINQIVFTPIFNSYFFGMQSGLSGATPAEIVERIKHTVPRSWFNSWKLWPVVTAFSFAFVRVELRGLFAGVIAIGWQAYLSVLNQRAAKMEEAQSETRQIVGRKT